MTLQKGGIPDALKPAARFIQDCVERAFRTRDWFLNGATVVGATLEGWQHCIVLFIFE